MTLKTNKSSMSVAFFIYMWRRQPKEMQVRMLDELLLHAYYTSHRQKPSIDDRSVLRHPVEEEMMRCVAAGISMNDFIVDWLHTHPTSSVTMLRRRWHKVVKLAHIFKQYSDPMLDTPLHRDTTSS